MEMANVKPKSNPERYGFTERCISFLGLCPALLVRGRLFKIFKEDIQWGKNK
ncbi:MAG: hypothetical protein HXS48_21445 [Theionarchaea archaeon]|nr:hypothetical protein [Theionarchaea archaeon]